LGDVLLSPVGEKVVEKIKESFKDAVAFVVGSHSECTGKF